MKMYSVKYSIYKKATSGKKPKSANKTPEESGKQSLMACDEEAVKMNKNVSRDILAKGLTNTEAMNYWIEQLQDTSPNHYGIEDFEIAVEKESIIVDMKEETFEFKDASLIITARMMGSSEESGFDQTTSVTTSGAGTFKLIGNDDLKISSITLDDSVELFSS